MVETAQRIKKSIVRRAESDANLVGAQIRIGLQQNFRTDSAGNITDLKLQNRVRIAYGEGEAILQSPTIQDIAARYDVYQQYLTPKQRSFMMRLRETFEKGAEEVIEDTRVINPGWNKVLRDNLPNWDSSRIRADVTGKGFYITRGRIRPKDGSEVFNISDEFVQQGRKSAIPAEKSARMPAMGKMVDENGNLIPELNAHAYDSLDKTAQGFIKEVADRVTDIKVRGEDGILTGLARKHKGKTRIPRTEAGRDVLEGVDQADDALASAIKREFLANPFYNKPLIKNVNNWYRGLKANFDLSAIGIHGSLAMFRAPVQWSKATGLSFRALKSPSKSQEIVDEAVMTINREAKANGRLASRIWGTLGLRQGGTSVETMLPGAEKLLERGGRVPGFVGGAFNLSNRLFGSFGDVLRLRWADELLRIELAKGKTINQMFIINKKTGLSELQEIANAANRLTGWSDKQFGGDIGELAMFASRFFQSRLETLGQSLVGASRLRLPTREALGQTRLKVNMPLRMADGRLRLSGKPMIESDVLASMGRAQTIESREALQTMIRLIGIGAFLTELANGGDTDRRPFVDGRVNPNFYTIRMGGRDFSVFGPTIGLLRAIGTLAVGVSTDRSVGGARKAIADASRGLGSGVTRLLWDNITGYGFRGDPAPLGLKRGAAGDDPRGYVADPLEILKYIGELALPISPGAVGGELYEGAKSVGEEDWGRVAGAVAGIGAEAIGGRVSRLSRQDEADELSQEIYGMPHKELAVNIQAEIDDLVTEKMGEYGYRGAKGAFYEKRDEIKDKLLTGLAATVKESLTADIASANWSAKIAREEYNELRDIRRTDLYGTWDKEKQRTVGGVYEQLYDRDKQREEPEEGTQQHNVWKYYKIFEDALDEDGDIQWDEFDRLESAFWASLKTVGEREEMLKNIRTIEREYPEEIRKMAYAGRYAQDVKLDVAGHSTTYWALREHPRLIRFIATEAEVADVTVLEYLDLSYAEREQRRHVKGEARDMEDALKKARSPKGLLSLLQEKFINDAPNEWMVAMMEAGYSYRGSEKINNRMRDQLRGGATMPKIPYEEMYKQQVVSR